MSEKESPKLFISYSWSSTEYEQWVINLATELRESGVDVILDKWDLKEGHDAHAFMEKMVTDSNIKKVALLCDRTYAEKADGRSGGVGTETQIITPELYARKEQDKFVAIIVERSEEGKPYLPTYYKSRKYIDLSNQELYTKNFEQLLRWIYDKPFYKKPELGKQPAFLSDDSAVSLGTSATFRRTLEAIRGVKEYRKGALNEYFNTFSVNLEKFRIPIDNNGEIDDKVVKNIETFLPYRNEIVEIFIAISQYLDVKESVPLLHHFFESLIPYLDKPKNTSQWSKWDFDNFKFIVEELFLYAIASFLKYERFEIISALVGQNYYVEEYRSPSDDSMVSFSVFNNYLETLHRRNERLKLNRISVHSDLLELRSKTSILKFHDLMQADFVLFIRDSLDCLKDEKKYQGWWPNTLVYSERQYRPFEIFARAQSKEYFEKIKIMFNISRKEELELLWQAFRERKLRIPSGTYHSVNPLSLMGYENLATKT